VKVLVTGGTGFVGPKVVRAIVDAGHDVRALARDRKKAAHVAALGAELVEGDVTDPASLRRAVQGMDAVVHLVGIRQGKQEEFQRIMIDGTRSLLAAADEAGVQRLVLMSALGATE
jgi:dihydroflavonol-4-reductase